MSILNFFQTGQLRENELSDFNWFLDRFEKNKLMKKIQLMMNTRFPKFRNKISIRDILNLSKI